MSNRRGSSRIGGLTFANNNFKIASPDYDTFNQATAVQNNKWNAGKAGIESTADFIEGQNVLDADDAIKSNTTANFTDAIGGFVESGRYEDATYALDGAVRDFRKDKGFAQATNNFKEYSAWAQAQRNTTGWDEADKNGYIQKGIDNYKGVQVNDDGTVSGSFNTREMGDYQNVPEVMREIMKDFDKEVRTEDLLTIQTGIFKDPNLSGGVLNNKNVDRTQERKYLDRDRAIAYAKNQINENPELKHFFETRRIINSGKLPSQIQQSFHNEITSDQTAIRTFNAEYSHMPKNSTKRKEFDEDYAFINQSGESSGRANYVVKAVTDRLINNGALSIGNNSAEGMSPAKIYRNYADSMEAYDYALKSHNSEDAESRVNIEAITERGNAGEILEATEQLIYDGAKYKAIADNSDVNTFKDNQAYQSILPISASEVKVKKHYWDDDGVLLKYNTKQEAIKARRILPATTSMGKVVATELNQSFSDDGVKGLEGYNAANKVDLMTIQDNVVTQLTNLQKAINEYNADDANANNKISDLEGIDGIVNGDVIDLDKDNMKALINLSSRQLDLMGKDNPANRDAYIAHRNSLFNAHNKYSNGVAIRDLGEQAAIDAGDVDVMSPELLESQIDYVLGHKGDLTRAEQNALLNSNDSRDVASQIAIHNIESKYEHDLSKSKAFNDKVRASIDEGSIIPKVNVSGIYYTGNEANVNDVTNTEKSATRDFLDHIKQNAGVYQVVSEDGVSENLRGLHADKSGLGGSFDINHARIKSFEYSPLDGSVIYYLDASSAGPINAANEEDLHTIRYVDEAGIYNGFYDSIRKAKGNDKISLPEGVERAMSNQDRERASLGKVNYNRMRSGFMDNRYKETDVEFTLTNGVTKKLGTMEVFDSDFYYDENGLKVKKDPTHRKFQLRYDIETDDGTKSNVFNFDSFNDAQVHIDQLYNTVISGTPKS